MNVHWCTKCRIVSVQITIFWDLFLSPNFILFISITTCTIQGSFIGAIENDPQTFEPPTLLNVMFSLFDISTQAGVLRMSDWMMNGVYRSYHHFKKTCFIILKCAVILWPSLTSHHPFWWHSLWWCPIQVGFSLFASWVSTQSFASWHLN